jgi:hypothetical protein
MYVYALCVYDWMYLLAEVRLRGQLHLSKHHRGDLLGGELLGLTQIFDLNLV